MQKSEGVSLLVIPGAPLREQRTITCNHCGGIRPYTHQDVSGREVSNVFWCDTCDARVCGSCINEKRDHSCVVWERKMEMMEARGRFIASVLGPDFS